ncbi:hypothetical protein PHYPSEUDO_004867 [Phytophthora pseudosyringae]|uniref:Transmembrane protein n=1 Tax=Phytophthora pseudosyringae TaxID=221518 RepID=A0A8T1VNF0_9STRA|nr:hypothetical protein PHYPSEUDO_004867 [Phytophthora pseudosyringae]
MSSTTGTYSDATRTESSSQVRQMSSLLDELDRKWSNVQVGRQGKYSIERLESFHHYCKSTSTTHAVLVCVLTPVPALATMIFIEVLPLRPPSEGWAANWVFWIRLSMISFILVVVGMSVLRRIVVGLPLSLAKILTIASGLTTGCTGLSITLALLVGFPVPFVWLCGGLSSGIVISVMLVLTLGSAPFRRNSPHYPCMQRFHSFLVAHEILIMVYPLVKVLYNFIPPRYQVFVILVLPLWKFGAKKFMIHAVRDLEDFVPQIVAFSVDFFSALFVAVCMFNSVSIVLSVLAIAVDLLLSVFEFRELRSNADMVYNLLQGNEDSTCLYQQSPNKGPPNLLGLLRLLTRDPKRFGLSAVPEVHLWACGLHPIPSESFDALQKLERLKVYNSRTLPLHRQRITLPAKQQQPQRISVVPLPADPVTITRQNRGSGQDVAHAAKGNSVSPAGDFQSERSKKLIVQGLGLLFHCEYLTLVEYIEWVTPIILVIYKSVLQTLPNVVFFPGGADIWRADTVGNMLLYSLMELCTFLALNSLLQRKFAFSPLYQLAILALISAFNSTGFDENTTTTGP